MQTNKPNSRPSLLAALALFSAFTLIVAAADREFSGKWKGETKAQAPAAPGRGAGLPGGAPPAGGAGAGAPAGGAAPQAPAGGGAGGGGRGGGGRFGGGGGFGATGPQKVTLNLKQSKDDKVSGNITVGNQTEDVKDGRINGTSITFKSGKAPAPIYEWIGELKDGELSLRRISSDGRGRPTEMVLKKD